MLVGPHWPSARARAGVVYSTAYGDQPALVCEMERKRGRLGAHLRLSTSSAPARAPSTCRASTNRRTDADLEPLRPHARGSGQGRHEPANVQLLRLTAQNPPSRWRPSPMRPGWRRHPTACYSRPAASTTSPPFCARASMAACWSAPARWRPSLPRWSATAARCSATCAGASMSVFEADPSTRGDYARRCFKEDGVVTDSSGRYTARSTGPITPRSGLELGASVANAASAQRTYGRDGGLQRRRGGGGQAPFEGRARRWTAKAATTVWGKLFPAPPRSPRAACPSASPTT